MNEFPLKIVTPAGLRFDGQAQQLIVRTTGGDVAILARHVNYVASLGMGEASITVDGQKRYAACMGGMVSVVDGAVTLVPASCEWAEDIDVERAKSSEDRAKGVLDTSNVSDTDVRLASARLKRALIRQNVASHRPK